MAITDILTCVCILFLIWKGTVQGFLGSLLGPLGLILGTIISYIYYIFTKNLFISLLISLIAPLILTWTFRFILGFWNKFNNPDKHISIISRILGALLSIAWGMTMYVILILLLAMVPPVNPVLQVISKDINSSYLYLLVKPFNPVNPTTAPGSKKTSEENIKELSNDKRIQDIINDPVISAAINRKDYAALMANPKITALIQDPQMIKKMMALYKDLPPEQRNLQINSK